MASSAACECGAEEQTEDPVVLQCTIHRPPHGLDGLTVVYNETLDWLLNTCPEIQCGLAVDSNNSLKRSPFSKSEKISRCFVDSVLNTLQYT